jgi:hypothetical protein
MKSGEYDKIDRKETAEAGRCAPFYLCTTDCVKLVDISFMWYYYINTIRWYGSFTLKQKG